ncbi:hypothetical protein AAG906_015438 [Vitis piasezkii]
MVVLQRSTILRQALILISQPSNALTAIRLIPPVWISHNFKATTLGMTKKTMRNRGFEPWTFRSCLGYHHFVINDDNCDRRKKDSKKTSTTTVAEIKTKANVAEKVSALVAATDHGGKFLNTFTPIINSAWIIDYGATDHMTFDSRQDIQTRQTIGCGIKWGKLYYLDLHSKDSNKLQQALMADGSEEEKKNGSRWFVTFIDDCTKMTWLCLMKTKDEVNLLFQKFHKMIETQYNAKVRVLRSDNGGEYQKVVRVSLIAAKIPISYWGEAITSVAYLINWTLDYDYHIFEEDESGQSELVHQEAGGLDMSGQQFGSENVFTKIPNQSSSAKGVLNLEPDPFMKRLPHCHNRALAYPRWKATMNEEMKSLQKNETWELVECPRKEASWVSLDQSVKYKQSSRAWFGRFTKSIRAFGYRQNNSDHTLFLKKQHGKITTLIVYLDDMVVTGNDLEERKALQNYLFREFEMKDLGPLKYFLGIEYALDLLQETGMSGCQPVNTPIEEAHTRPDVAYALSVVSQYMHNPGEQHMNAVMLDDRRSTYGYFTFVGGNLVTWKSKKQNVIAHSSGMALGLCEALWLRLLLQDLGYLSRQPIRLFCDNKAACDIAHNPVQHDRTKHVEVDRFFIKEKLDDKIVELPKIRSKNQLADILTKVVSSQVFSKFLYKLGMCDIYAPT